MSARASYTGGDSFLLTQFREFYQEVVRWKRLAARDGQLLQVSAAGAPGALVMTGSPGTAPGALMLVGGGAVAGPAAAAVTPSVAPATIWQSLLGLLNRQEAEVRRTGGEYASATGLADIDEVVMFTSQTTATATWNMKGFVVTPR